MKKESLIFILCCLIVSVCPLSGFGAVEWNVRKTLVLDETPKDVASSVKGTWLFVLTEGGTVLVYSADGVLKEKIDVGRNIDGISAGSQENSLLLVDKEKKTIQQVRLDFIYDIDITGSPFKGPKDAPVVITVFSDFQCPYCARLLPLLQQVVDKNPDHVKLVFKNFPLPNHRFARKAAAAALAADEFGRFWEFHDQLFKYSSRLSDEKIKEIAKGLGLDENKIETNMGSSNIQAKINKDMKDAKEIGVRGTPSIFVNGRRLKNRSLAGFQFLIDAELAKSGIDKNGK